MSWPALPASSRLSSNGSAGSLLPSGVRAEDRGEIGDREVEPEVGSLEIRPLAERPCQLRAGVADRDRDAVAREPPVAAREMAPNLERTVRQRDAGELGEAGGVRSLDGKAQIGAAQAGAGADDSVQEKRDTPRLGTQRVELEALRQAPRPARDRVRRDSDSLRGCESQGGGKAPERREARSRDLVRGIEPGERRKLAQHAVEADAIGTDGRDHTFGAEDAAVDAQPPVDRERVR